MNLEFWKLVILFFIYSFIGYCLEILSVYKNTGKFTLSRGYLIGPYLPIFGSGAISMGILLQKYQGDYLTLFILGVILCCLIEYFTSYILEKLFHLRWWDYSDRKYNINGRICLENGIYFGLAGLLVVEVLNPLLLRMLDNWSKVFVTNLGIILFLLLFVDFVVSTYIVIKLKLDVEDYNKKDSTSVIKSEILASLEKHSFFRRRIFKAFPRIKEGINIDEFNNIILNKKKRVK